MVSWGNDNNGADSSGVDFSGGVNLVVGNDYSFAAIKNDGSVVGWGSDFYG